MTNNIDGFEGMIFVSHGLPVIVTVVVAAIIIGIILYVLMSDEKDIEV